MLEHLKLFEFTGVQIKVGGGVEVWVEEGRSSFDFTGMQIKVGWRGGGVECKRRGGALTQAFTSRWGNVGAAGG